MTLSTLSESAKLMVVQPKGRLDSVKATELQQQLTEMVTQDNVTLLVDMGEVEFLDSSGLVTLVSGLKQARRVGNRLAICSLREPVRLIFEITRLDQVFEIFDSYDAFTASAA